MIRDLLRSLPPDVVAIVLGLAVAAVLLVPIGLVVRVVARWRGWPLGVVRIPGSSLLLAVATSVGTTLLVANWSGGALLGGCVAIGLPWLLLGRWLQHRRGPFRAIRRMNAGDYAGAAADLRSRVDRQRAALNPVPPSGPGDDSNPYAAPATTTLAPANPLQLAHDLANLGCAEENLGNWAAALAAFDEAITIAGAGPLGPLLRGNRGYALIALGRVDEGFALLRAAIEELAPGDHWVRAQFLAGLAEQLLARGETAEIAGLVARARLEEQDERVQSRIGKKLWLARLDAIPTQLEATRLVDKLAPRDDLVSGSAEI